MTDISAQPVLRLGFGAEFQDLYDTAGLARLDGAFLEMLERTAPQLAERLVAARNQPESLLAKARSELIIALAPHVEEFISELFGISSELQSSKNRHDALEPLYAVKRKFVQKRALTRIKPDQAALINGEAVAGELVRFFKDSKFFEDEFAANVHRWLENEPAHEHELDLATRYAAWAVLTPAGQAKHRNGLLFKTPHKLDPHHLIPLDLVPVDGIHAFTAKSDHLRHREGFGLTDPGMDLRQALDHAHYCIKCHNQGKDSCATGLKEKDGSFKKSVFGVTLAGCPLEEKISEMNTVKLDGYTVGALAIVTIDNPMAAGTGHRICNDCMKACIFQKQDPVDIPQVETRTLKDVLDLPWGFEIYSLLTRWNPLNFERPLPKPDSGYKVLVVGLGPAGYTLAHHLMNDGHTVVGVDGLKIEPLDSAISGVTPLGERVPFRPIYRVEEIYESLDERVMAGFGGVAEYGITVRWDKNFLKVIRLLLERRRQFAMFGGVRFGGTLTVENAFEMGFDHIALSMGAGRPTIVDMKNGLARGVRQASDFLMALQLTGAAKDSSLANLQLRMPVVVIGGGLTAIDTATEARAYYLTQIEKFLHRYESLCAEIGEEAVRAVWSEEEATIAGEFISHARQVRFEREEAARAGRVPSFRALIDSWGGITIAYRRRLVDAPSYTLNHEEVAKAFEEGIRFAEELTPSEVVVDEFGHAAALTLRKRDGMVTLPAKSILVAAGTQPNTVLAREFPATFLLDGKYFQAVSEAGTPVKPERVAKPSTPEVLLSTDTNGGSISFFGDLHPSFAGNVVKAMASAKQGYPVVSRTLARQQPSQGSATELLARANRELRAVVHQVIRLTPTIIEVIVRAPFAARAFEPGQFYRLQNYETLAPGVNGTRLNMEGLALTGASVDREKGLISVIVLEMGGSSDLCQLLKPGEPVILMGPTGAPTEVPHAETVLLAGGGLGNAVLFSIGQKLRSVGSRVLYFAGYKKLEDRYKVEEIEKAADVVVWCCDEHPGFAPARPQDRTVVANIVEAMTKYAMGALGQISIPLSEVDRIIAIGSDGMMRAVAQARHGVLLPFLREGHQAIGSINSPMQCMMKEICAQCLQIHRDPKTGEERVIFSCFNQDQPLDHVDFSNLRSRLSQNGAQEKLTKLWIDRCLRTLGVRSSAAVR
jgi:NADPH-dependent glutamate synthase beta subunit-like oxidoreductase/NAD(P)H-flavin reductase